MSLAPHARTTRAAHLVLVFTVLSARIHYTVDVLGAWVITYAVYRLAGSRSARAGQRGLP